MEVDLHCTVIKLDVYFIVVMRQSGLHRFQALILEDFPSFPTVCSPLKSRGNFIYLTIYKCTKNKYCITAYLCVPYDSQKEQILFPHTGIDFVILTELQSVYWAVRSFSV